jgi:hypothetical protein
MQASLPQDAVENYVKKYFENVAWLKYIGTLGCLKTSFMLLKPIEIGACLRSLVQNTFIFFELV